MKLFLLCQRVPHRESTLSHCRNHGNPPSSVIDNHENQRATHYVTEPHQVHQTTEIFVIFSTNIVLFCAVLLVMFSNFYYVNQMCKIDVQEVINRNYFKISC